MLRRVAYGIGVVGLLLALAACAEAVSSYEVPLADIDPGQPYRMFIGGQLVGLILAEDGSEVRALLLRDTHPSHGDLAWMPADERFISPRTGSTFSRTGEYILGPAPRGLDWFAATIDGDTVVVDLTRRYRGRRPQ